MNISGDVNGVVNDVVSVAVNTTATTTLLAIHLLLIITKYSYWLYFTITVHLNYNRSHINIIDDNKVNGTY